MRITVKPWGGHGNNTKYEIIVSTQDAHISEDWLEQDEVDSMAVEFFDSTALNNLTHNGVVQRIIDLGVVDEKMIWDWVEENKQENS